MQLFGFRFFEPSNKVVGTAKAVVTGVKSLATAAAQSPTAMREAVVATISIVAVKDLFQHGRMVKQATFKFNTITIRNLQNRKAVLRALARSTKDEFMAVPFQDRKVAFAFLKQETARYNGTAIRQKDTANGKAGEPLPKLKFPTPQDAAAYRSLLQDAMRNISSHVYKH